MARRHRPITPERRAEALSLLVDLEVRARQIAKAARKTAARHRRAIRLCRSLRITYPMMADAILNTVLGATSASPRRRGREAERLRQLAHRAVTHSHKQNQPRFALPTSARALSTETTGGKTMNEQLRKRITHTVEEFYDGNPEPQLDLEDEDLEGDDPTEGTDNDGGDTKEAA